MECSTCYYWIIFKLINMEYKYIIYAARCTLQTPNVQLNRFKFIGRTFWHFINGYRCKFNFAFPRTFGFNFDRWITLRCESCHASDINLVTIREFVLCGLNIFKQRIGCYCWQIDLIPKGEERDPMCKQIITNINWIELSQSKAIESICFIFERYWLKFFESCSIIIINIESN